MRFEIEIPDSVIEDAILKAICERSVKRFEDGRDIHSRREFTKHVREVTKIIVERNEQELIDRAVAYAGDKIARDAGKNGKEVIE